MIALPAARTFRDWETQNARIALLRPHFEKNPLSSRESSDMNLFVNSGWNFVDGLPTGARPSKR
jgi:hypothetical protein